MKQPEVSLRDSGLRVRLLVSAGRPPATAAERAIQLAFARERNAWRRCWQVPQMRFTERKSVTGAVTSILPLLGSSLFVPEVRRALTTGDGELWQIG